MTRSGSRRFERALAEGAALERDDAVAWLRRARGARKRPGHGWESLTPTEVEVVRQAAAGLTNPQIAERLFVARATVKTHLSHVYAKLGVRNRSQLAAACRRARSRRRYRPARAVDIRPGGRCSPPAPCLLSTPVPLDPHRPPGHAREEVKAMKNKKLSIEIRTLEKIETTLAHNACST